GRGTRRLQLDSRRLVEPGAQPARRSLRRLLRARRRAGAGRPDGWRGVPAPDHAHHAGVARARHRVGGGLGQGTTPGGADRRGRGLPRRHRGGGTRAPVLAVSRRSSQHAAPGTVTAGPAESRMAGTARCGRVPHPTDRSGRSGAPARHLDAPPAGAGPAGLPALAPRAAPAAGARDPAPGVRPTGTRTQAGLPRPGRSGGRRRPGPAGRRLGPAVGVSAGRGPALVASGRGRAGGGAAPGLSDRETAGGAMRHWRPFGLGVVRAAGFGFDLVDGLAEPDLYHTARRWSEVRRELDQAAAAFRAAAAAAPRITVSEQMRAARRGLRRIDRRQPLAPGDPVPDRIADHPGGHEFRDWWNARCEESVRLAGQARHAYAAGLRSARGHLDSSLREPRVRAALTLLTPEILETAVRALLRRPPQAPAPNQAERKAVAFLQRLAAKCETNGIAGPIGYATLGPPQVPVPAASGHRGFVAFWAVVALVRQALRRWADGGAPLRV